MVNAAKCFLETYEVSECFLTLSWYLWLFLRWKPGQHLTVSNTDSAAVEFSLTAFFVMMILWKTLLLKAISHCTVWTEKLFLLNEVFASVAMVPIIVNSLPENRKTDKLEYCCHGISNKNLMRIWDWQKRRTNKELPFLVSGYSNISDYQGPKVFIKSP